MSGDRLEEFFEEKSIHMMYQLTREELYAAAERFNVRLEGERKEDLQLELKGLLKAKGWFRRRSRESSEDEEEEEEGVRSESPLGCVGVGDLEGFSSAERLEIMKLRIQAEKEIQVQKEETKRQMQKEETERQRIRAGSRVEVRESKDGDRRVKYVPKYVEGEEENYFLQFEKTARIREWAEGDWAFLAQLNFEGKARDAYVSLNDQESRDYEVVKEAVLKSTRLSPGVYRERFRNVKKRPGDTYLEMARECCLKLDRWMKSEAVTTIEEMREVILMEHFLDQLPPSVRYELISHDVKDVMEAGRKADNYCQAHGLSREDYKGGRKPFSSKGDQDYRGRSGYQPNSRPYFKPNQSRHDSHYPSHKSSRTPQHSYNLRPALNKNWRESSPPHKRGEGSSDAVKCLGCGITGHKKYECRKSKPKPVAAVVSLPNPAELFGASDPSILKHQQGEDDVEHFTITGTVKVGGGPEKKIRIFRDTGARQSMILRGSLPGNGESYTGREVVCQGEGDDDRIFRIPLHKVWLDCGYITGEVMVGVKETFIIKGVDMLIGSDLASKRIIPKLQMVENPVREIMENPTQAADPNPTREEELEPEVFPVCAVTRARARLALPPEEQEIQEDQPLGALFAEPCVSEGDEDRESDKRVEDHIEPRVDLEIEKGQLIREQERDESLKFLWREAKRSDELEEDFVGFFVDRGVLMRSWRPLEVPAGEHWKMKKQIVVPQVYREKIVEMAHEGSLAGHLGVRKTLGKIRCHFYWPKMKSQITEFCRTCPLCQKVGKPNQGVRPAPLRPIPVIEEPFSKIVIDCVGPLPRTRRGNQYLLTVMCAASRFPEAIPLRSVNSKNVVRELVKFFSWVGIPKVIQSDQGSNFTSRVFKEILRDLKIEQRLSSAYHPQSQGCVERFHQTMKNTLRMYCVDLGVEWDEALPLVLFTLRDSVQESTGFSPFELVYGHEVNGPLRMVKEKWLGKEDPPNVVKYVAEFKDRLMRAREIAKENLRESQDEMKRWYDRKARARTFNPGDKVLVLFPLQGNPFRARFSGPWEIEKKISDENYIVKTPGRRKKNQLCHVNMLKRYHERGEKKSETEGEVKPVCTVTVTSEIEEKWAEEKLSKCEGVVLENSEIMKNLKDKIGLVDSERKEEIIEIIERYRTLFPDAPRKTNVVVHDVDVGDAEPIKQHAYRVNPKKREIMRKEVEYMLENELIEPSESPWSSPCVLVPKTGQDSFRFCTDYRKVNNVTKADAYPIPRIDDCIDNVGNANYITKLDLLKGYWQVELTDRAKAVSAFVTMDGLYQYKVLPFGMKNSGSSFQRLMNRVLQGLRGCSVYIDDILLYTEGWEEHLELLDEVFRRLDEANLTVNLAKSVFVQADVEYLGFKIGKGMVRTVEAKVRDILDMPPPTNRKEVLRFLGASGYYRRFCKNFSDVAMPLTQLLNKQSRFKWSNRCEEAFNEIKDLLVSAPILRMPDFERPFSLYVDASQHGIGGVLMQEHEGIDHPIGYYSKKLLPYQCSYSTIEKEALGLILSLHHFEIYVKGAGQPVTVFTDHNPLVFLHKMKNTNQRLMRWSLTLQDYDLKIEHVKGSENVIADALSRAPFSREAT